MGEFPDAAAPLGNRPPSDRCWYLGPDSSSVNNKIHPKHLYPYVIHFLWSNIYPHDCIFSSLPRAPPSAAVATMSSVPCVFSVHQQISPSVCDCFRFPQPAACFPLYPELCLLPRKLGVASAFLMHWSALCIPVTLLCLGFLVGFPGPSDCGWGENVFNFKATLRFRRCVFLPLS